MYQRLLTRFKNKASTTTLRRSVIHFQYNAHQPSHGHSTSAGGVRADERISQAASNTPQDSLRKLKSKRSPPGATSLRQVAVEAQRSRDGLQPTPAASSPSFGQAKRVRAYCVAEQFHLPTVIKALEAEGYDIDPYRTALYPQVVHVEVPVSRAKLHAQHQSDVSETGDVFIFSSGTAVAWFVAEATALDLVTKTLIPAARTTHLDQIETEDLDYVEDASKEISTIKGDTIMLGTKLPATNSGAEAPRRSRHAASESTGGSSTLEELRGRPSNVNTILAKVAFSSGLARSTKLAVLEKLLADYFESTRSIPTLMSRGSRLPFTRSFILRKTGQLLSVRAQLNLYSELTDSIPDIFWDSKHELGLEGYYDQVGRALDVSVRIKLLNMKMDYAQEIASVLRERLSEKHGLTLEWMIIVLIAVEVGFEVIALVRERSSGAGILAATPTTG